MAQCCFTVKYVIYYCTPGEVRHMGEHRGRAGQALYSTVEGSVVQGYTDVLYSIA